MPSVILFESDRAFLKELKQTELAYLSSMQLQNGAIPMNRISSGQVLCNPYFADFSALAMLESQENAVWNGIKKYLQWHFSHLNFSDYNGLCGTIYDYTLTVEEGRCVHEAVVHRPEGIPCYDSTDSYAATFLLLCANYAEKAPDDEILVANTPKIEEIIGVMSATMDQNLTYARLDYPVQYLMDNCETFAGFCAAKRLYETALSFLPDAGKKAEEMKQTAEKIQKTVCSALWREDHFSVAVNAQKEDLLPFSWTEFYPSATAQLFPILFGVISPDSDKAKKVYEAFCYHYAGKDAEWNWPMHKIPSKSYWSVMAVVAAKMGDVSRAVCYLKQYALRSVSHQKPLYNADIGWAILACSLLLSDSSKTHLLVCE